LKRIVRKVEADPQAKLYRDEALTPVTEEDSEHMELYTQNEAARSAVERELRVAGKSANGHGHKAEGASGRAGNGHEANGRDAAHAPLEPHSDHSEPISPIV
jgi:hypothetical protein